MLNPDRKYSLLIDPVDYTPEGQPEGDDLTSLADWYKTDKGNIKHLYTPIYERLMTSRRNDEIDMLEIGVACGCSLKMWSHYFLQGRITGLDVRPECRNLCKGYENIEIVIGDACEYKPGKQFNFIIDDGSHVSLDIVKTWENLWKHVKPGGLYIIEDTKCTHNPQYQKLFEWPRNADDFSRRHVLIWLDTLTRRMDNRQGDVEFIQMHTEMIVLGKK